jgi:enoyl-CoA hydratase/carnithine racemase
MPDLDSGVRAGGDIIFRVDGGAAILQLGSGRASHLLFTAGRIDAARAAETGLVDILTDDLDAELADFLNALRAADMPTLLAIRDTIRQVR